MTLPTWFRSAGKRWEVAVLALLAYLPALTAAPGKVLADTKLYLTLDPGRLISDAIWTWDGRQFGGWVPHQNVGYLWPSGPWFATGNALGLPEWLTQRLWIGTILFLAGLGVRWCARHLGLSPTAAIVAAVVYQCSPYVLPYISRTSVLLPPWAGLGWLIGLTVLATRLSGRRRWWPIAAFGLVIVTIGGINATAMLMIAPAPVIYLLDAAARREITWRRAFAVGGALAGVSAMVSVWWLTGLAIQARHGANALSYSEALESTAYTSSAPEVLRGLGYWLFYVRDHVTPLTSASQVYQEVPLVITAGWLVVLAGAAGLLFVQWRGRRFAASILMVGTILAVGAHPVGDSSPLWSPLTEQSRNSLVLALRSSTRATPLVLLGLGLGAGVLCDALLRQRRIAGQAAVVGVVVLALMNLPALWTGAYADPALSRSEVMSTAWRDAARMLDDEGGGRVLLVPGMESAAYRWGYTVENPLPGLSDRPLVTRDWLPLGSPGLMDVLYALDDRFQSNTIEADAIAPIARLLGATTVMVVNDTQFERFDTVRPETSWSIYQSGVEGLGAPTTFGDPAFNEPTVDMVDDEALTRPRANSPLPPLAILPVTDPVDAARASSRVVLVAGSGDGVVDAAAAGLLDGTEVLVFSAALADDDLERAIGDAALVLITDSNRARARSWRSSQDVWGFTEDGGSTALLDEDPFDHRLPVFPDQELEHQTLASQVGFVTATATSYGSPTRYWPEFRPFQAIDGDLSTSWLVGDDADPRGQRLRLTVDRPSSQVTLVQHQDSSANRWIDEVEITTDAHDVIRVNLDERSRTSGGQVVALPQMAGVVEIEIRSVVGLLISGSAVGFAEVDAGQGAVIEVVRPPTDLVDRLPSDAPVVWALTRDRADPTDRRRLDPEQKLHRELQIPHDVDVTVSVTVRLSPRASDSTLTDLLGHAPALADRRAAGGLEASGMMAVDGDPATAWVSPFDAAVGSTLIIGRDDVPLDTLTLTQRVNRPHALITEVTLGVGDDARTVPVPAPNESGRSTLAFDPLPGGALTLTVTDTNGRTTVDRQTGRPVELPVSIAEIEGAGVWTSPLPAILDTDCRTDLLQIGGRDVGLRIVAPSAQLRAGMAVQAERCDGSATTALSAGPVAVSSATGYVTGIDIDRVVLSTVRSVTPAPASQITVEAVRTRSGATYQVGPCPDGCWFVQGDGWSSGWWGTIDGTLLGTPRHLGAGMNGWWLPASTDAHTVHMTWSPQRWMWFALAVSGISVLLCAAACIGAVVRRPTAATSGTTSGPIVPILVDRQRARRGPWWVAPVTGVVGMAVVDPLWGLSLGVIIAAAWWCRRTWLVPAAAWLLIAAAGAIVVFSQIRYGYAAGFGWPVLMELAHRPALAGVVLLFASNLGASCSTPPTPASPLSSPATTKKEPSPSC